MGSLAANDTISISSFAGVSRSVFPRLLSSHRHLRLLRHHHRHRLLLLLLLQPRRRLRLLPPPSVPTVSTSPGPALLPAMPTGLPSSRSRPSLSPPPPRNTLIIPSLLLLLSPPPLLPLLQGLHLFITSHNFFGFICFCSHPLLRPPKKLVKY